MALLYISSLLAVLFCAVNAKAVCHPGWTFHEGSCYPFVNVDLTWYVAQAFRQSFDARLVEPNTASENDFLKHLAESRNAKGVWITGTDGEPNSNGENCSYANITSALRTVIQRLDGVEKKLDMLIDQQVHSDEYFDIMNTGKEWRLAFRGTPYINQSVYDAYKNGIDVPNDIEPGCKKLDDTLPCRNHYRNNDVLDKWANIDKVALILYDGNTQVKHLIFDGQGSTYMDWLSQARLERSSWTDVKTANTTNFFSIEGDNILVRRFLINRSYGGCPNDYGWIVAQDRAPAYCQQWWESSPSFPVFKYSKEDTYTNWQTGNVGTASFMTIFVKYTT